MKNIFSKIFIACVVITYVLSTIGVSVFSHYCGGELENISLFTKAKSCCGGEEEESNDDGCCKNETVHVSFQKDFTFYTHIKTIKASINNLFIIKQDFNIIPLQCSINDFSLIDKKTHPPNCVQRYIVDSSVIRI